MGNATAYIAVISALAGAGTSMLATWFTQRIQLRRDSAERAYQNQVRWTQERRVVYRDIQATANDWLRLLRNIAQQLIGQSTQDALRDDQVLQAQQHYHRLTYETDLLCSPTINCLVDELEDLFLDLTTNLGQRTEYAPGASMDIARRTASDVLSDDFQQVRDTRLRLMNIMRKDLGLA